MNKIKFLFLLFIKISIAPCSLLAQKASTNFDTIEIQELSKKLQTDLEYAEFDSLLFQLSKHLDIHEFVIERLGVTNRTPNMHNYYPGYLNFMCSHMDRTYQKKIINLIESDSIERFLAYPIVKNCLFNSDKEVCDFLNSQNLKEKLSIKKSLMFESLVKLEIELNCSM